MAVDNDALLKLSCYGLCGKVWPPEEDARYGVLGAARYVLARALERLNLAAGRERAEAALKHALDAAEVLEPNKDELELAARLESDAQRHGLQLDAGESQLTAILVARDSSELLTGDKRAIRALEGLLDLVNGLDTVAGRVRCLEQAISLVAQLEGAFQETSVAICSEPDVDKTMSICFSCFSGDAVDRAAALEALENYISSLREKAPRILAP
ncbi:MAG: hypothetical protein WD556_06310 [Actinomycetota bacterium]